MGPLVKSLQKVLVLEKQWLLSVTLKTIQLAACGGRNSRMLWHEWSVWHFQSVCKVEIILGELTGRYISCHGLLVFTVWYTHPQLYIQRHNYSSMSMINICIQKPTHSTLTVCTHGQMKVLRGSVTFWYFVEVSHFCTECTALLFPIKWVFGSN